jgi:hypothetical protein
MITRSADTESFRWHGFVAMLIASALVASVAAAQSVSITGALELTQTYLPDEWRPVRLTLRNGFDRPIDGFIVLPLRAPSSPATMKIPVSMPPRSVMGVSVMAYFSHPQLAGRAKGSDLPPLSTCEFVDANGAVLSRTPIVGVPLLAKGGVPADDETGELIVLVNGRGDPRQEYDAEALFGRLASATGIPIVAASADAASLPTAVCVLRSARAIVLDGVDPESFNLVQRDAVVEYVRGGGTLVLSAPDESVAAASSWIAPLLPVTLVGKRQARQVATAEGGTTLKLRGPVTIIEALERDGQTLLRDRDYVHVAARPLGLGKVVFTSFPINALDPAQPQTAVLWEQLLSLRERRWDWSETRLGEARHDVLGGMIGRKVASWGVAAGVVAGYLLLIVAAQGFFFGPSRPRAFVASVAGALVLSTALIATGMARRGGQTLQAARLAIFDVAPDGGGWQRESVAYVGADDPEMKLQPADEAVMLRPALADANNRPTIRQQPFAIDNAQVFTDRIERVWEAARPLDPTKRITAVGQLGPDGLTLEVDNALQAPIESPLVIFNGRALALADLPSGRTTVRQLQPNARRQFTGLGVLTSDEAKRRAQVIAASLAPPSQRTDDLVPPAPPMLVGWVADAGEPLVAPVDRPKLEWKSMAMVRTPLQFELASAGSKVTVPAALVEVDTGRLPYDPKKGESVATPQGGSWQISFAAPPQTGHIKPLRLTIAARVALPAHAMRLHLGPNITPQPIAEWKKTAGGVEVVLDLAASQYDPASGRVPMTLEVESLDPAGNVPWQIVDLGATIEGTIIGPAASGIALDATTRPAAADTGRAQETK